MTWLSLLLGLLKLSSAIADYMKEKQLLEAGVAQALKEQLDEAMAQIRRASDARAAVKHDPDSVRSDPYNRDNKED